MLVVDEAYNLDDSMYGKQVLDVLVEKIQGTENDDIAVLLLGYEELTLKRHAVLVLGANVGNASESESWIGPPLPHGDGFSV